MGKGDERSNVLLVLLDQTQDLSDPVRNIDVGDSKTSGTVAPPTAAELILPLLIWSWVFEIILPATGWLGDWCVADYLDVMYYALGTLLAAIWWRWWYRPDNRKRE